MLKHSIEQLEAVQSLLKIHLYTKQSDVKKVKTEKVILELQAAFLCSKGICTNHQLSMK